MSVQPDLVRSQLCCRNTRPAAFFTYQVWHSARYSGQRKRNFSGHDICSAFPSSHNFRESGNSEIVGHIRDRLCRCQLHSAQDFVIAVSVDSGRPAVRRADFQLPPDASPPDMRGLIASTPLLLVQHYGGAEFDGMLADFERSSRADSEIAKFAYSNAKRPCILPGRLVFQDCSGGKSLR